MKRLTRVRNVLREKLLEQSDIHIAATARVTLEVSDANPQVLRDALASDEDQLVGEPD
jgi:hypothetical protein